MNQTIISLSTLAIDFIVCFAFGIRLLFLKEKKKVGKLVQYFMYFFLLFALFLLITPFYLPGVISADPLILKTTFVVAFGLLMAISVLVLAIVIPNEKAKAKEYIIPFWSMGEALIWIYLLFIINPASQASTKWGFWGFSPLTLALSAFVVGAPFIFASIIFLNKAIKGREERGKFLSLSVGFFLIIFGGPLHQFGKMGNLFLLADFVTTLGFILLFLAIVLKEKQKA